jgi:hypothetical protein
MAVIFDKNEKDDLSTVDRKAIAAMIRAYREELASDFNRGRVNHQEHERGGIDG